MDMEVFVPALEKQFSIDVFSGDTFTKAKNRSYSNASPFSEGAKLVQKKFCSVTGKEVTKDMLTHKILASKAAGNILIANEQLANIKAGVTKMDTGRVQITSILKRDSYELPYERVEGSKWIKPAKRRELDYVELRELCETHILIGKAIFKSNEYEIALVTVNGTLTAVKFATQDRMRDKPNLDGLQRESVSPELIEAERKRLSEQATDNHDFTAHLDSRAEKENELIEKIYFGEELPKVETVKATPDSIVRDDTAELERIKKLMSGSAKAEA